MIWWTICWVASVMVVSKLSYDHGQLDRDKVWLKALELEMKHLSNPDGFKGAVRYQKLVLLQGGQSEDNEAK